MIEYGSTRLTHLALFCAFVLATACTSSGSTLISQPPPACDRPTKTDSIGPVYPACAADSTPTPVFAPAPTYPMNLRADGVEGEVVVEFVLDTLGRVEARSIKAVSSTHPDFRAPTLKAMMGAIYRPAVRSGRPIRVLMREKVTYHIGEPRASAA